MKITDVKLKKIENEGGIKAFVSVVIDDCFAIHEIRVVETDKRLFIAMPNRKNKNGEYHDIVHPITKEARAMFESEILKVYEEAA